MIHFSYAELDRKIQLLEGRVSDVESRLERLERGRRPASPPSRCQEQITGLGPGGAGRVANPGGSACHVVGAASERGGGSARSVAPEQRH
jgi:hypothetical protein